MGKKNSQKTLDRIILKGVRQNNLKGFDLELPLGELIVVTGLSGSGKSSLVFETLHAEGQRRYVETFSPYTRQFLEIMDRPQVDEIENIHPSIAIQQSNTVKTSRSTVGTMTELCDFFKVWFQHVAELYDPATGKKIEQDSPQSVWRKLTRKKDLNEVLVTFQIEKPSSLNWKEIIEPVQKQGYRRILVKGKVEKLEELELKKLSRTKFIHVIQDRIKVDRSQKARFIDAATKALLHGKQTLELFSIDGKAVGTFSEELKSPKTGEVFKSPTPSTFSFNSPIGACPSCRGFGRIIEIDFNLVIPDRNLSIRDGAIRAFSGDVYGECLKDLLRHAKRLNIRTNTPWRELTEEEQKVVLYGEPDFQAELKSWDEAWYGVRGFFDWLESKIYKMHVRFLLSKYRAYTECPECGGGRLKKDALNWKWQGHTLPDLYNLSLDDLHEKLSAKIKPTGNHPVDLAAQAITTRLAYLNEVGLGYLTLNRTSRTLSGGEVERVNLTTCLGTSLVETLFVLDEPSVGLHSRDIHRLIKVMKDLTAQGNTVVVVEHDEAIMQAADRILEIGPGPGSRGGEICFNGPLSTIKKEKRSLTGRYLSGNLNVELPEKRRMKQRQYFLEFKGVSKNNIQELDFKLPLKRFVCLSGVSGSGKSTLLNNVIYQNLKADEGKAVEDPAQVAYFKGNVEFIETVLVDQGPISKTPRSNPALFVDAWDPIRQVFAQSDGAREAGLSPAYFSFNSGQGRCDQCQGLGYEKVEMQFLSDVYVSCPACEGKRFRESVLAIRWKGLSIADVLEMDVQEAMDVFYDYGKIRKRLQILESVGLNYLRLGQPLNTLSGGESQRLKLVRYMSKLEDRAGSCLLLLDEPTTGLHRDDVGRLVNVMHQLVDRGHSLVVIEHNMDVLKNADWIMEMGPEAGIHGGQIVYQGTPEGLAAGDYFTSPYLKDALEGHSETRMAPAKKKAPVLKAPRALKVIGAREHNLKNITAEIPHNQLTVLTGVSGSGKSSLAFDIIFAEGQRRFMESISPYARQFVEQLPKPDIDQLSGIAPTVAIEQRVTRGSRKSTVATVTEVAQYLRLLFARIGIQYSPHNNNPVVSLPIEALAKKLELLLKGDVLKDFKHLYLCAPVIQSRKGHHQPVANWARSQGYELLRVNGEFIYVSDFKPLNRYQEHDVEVVTVDLGREGMPLTAKGRRKRLEEALNIGKGSCLLSTPREAVSWFSKNKTDPITGDAFPDLDPKHFSWNSPKGWCDDCRGYGRIIPSLKDDLDDQLRYGEDISFHPICESCDGERLNVISRHVKLNTKGGSQVNLPQLLGMNSPTLLQTLQNLELDPRAERIVRDLIPEIAERLKFMQQVGLGYLTLDRSSSTLSGGEAQRIRLSAQLSSNLSGVLYVLDEPSIGLHARDNDRLIDSLHQLRDRGNTLLVVEHDDDTMRAADYLIDMGPGAGVHGGEIINQGTPKVFSKNQKSLTGQYLQAGIKHPIKGSYRKLPAKKEKDAWLTLEKPQLRNLKGNTLSIPHGRLTMVCGISGAGKSTMVRDLLRPALEHAIAEKKTSVTGKDLVKGGYFPEPVLKELTGVTGFRKVIEVDQEPIGKTLRSTPATYIGAFDTIRQLFANLPESKVRGYTASTFSFNTKNGRCDTCNGSGKVKLEMNFLPDTYVTCESCNGIRYSSELAELSFKDKSIGEILNLSFAEAVEFFDFHQGLQATMQLMVDTGLGYLRLGQSSPTLSGGEAQRLKLVSELAKGLPTYKEVSRNLARKPNIYILEEPTIGLHLSDCERLIGLLHKLVDSGHTVIVIEHNLDLIAEADYLVEIGPEGGEGGGKILYQGNLKGLSKCQKSPTLPFLKKKMPSR